MKKLIHAMGALAISLAMMPELSSITASANGMPGVKSAECGEGAMYPCFIFSPGSICYSNGGQIVWDRKPCFGPDDPRCN